MATQILTATKIEKYKPAKPDDRIADGNGLYMRFRANSSGQLSRSWMYAYKQGTASIYLTLGDYQASLPEFERAIYGLLPGARLTLDIARKIAAELTDWRRRRLDPKSHLQSEIDRFAAEAAAKLEAAARIKKQTQIENLSVLDLFNVWLEDGVRRKDGNAELQRSFNADVLPSIGEMPIIVLTEHHVRSVLRAMALRGVNRAAVIMRNNLMQMFAWAEKRQPWRKLLSNGNPMDLIEIDKIVSPAYDIRNQRNRLLSADEICELQGIFLRTQKEYDTASNRRSAVQPVEQTLQRAIWIMLSTLCRVGELSMARWEHINFDNGTWFIPKANVKGNLNDFSVGLSQFAFAQFQLLYELTGHTKWCFPSRNRNAHVDVKSMSKQIGDRQAVFKKNKDGNEREKMQHRRHDNSLVLGAGKNGAWTAHDLRRTGATMMQSLRVPLDIIDRCQNHVLAGSKVRRHYLHHDYVNEKCAAWQQLGERLSIITNASQNFVPYKY